MQFFKFPSHQALKHRKYCSTFFLISNRNHLCWSTSWLLNLIHCSEQPNNYQYWHCQCTTWTIMLYFLWTVYMRWALVYVARFVLLGSLIHAQSSTLTSSLISLSNCLLRFLTEPLTEGLNVAQENSPSVNMHTSADANKSPSQKLTAQLAEPWGFGTAVMKELKFEGGSYKVVLAPLHL